MSGTAQAADNLAEEEGEEGSDGVRLAGLKRQLEECRSELFEVYHQISELEAIADQVSPGSGRQCRHLLMCQS